MLTILLSFLNLIRSLICGNNYSWLLDLNLVYETLGLWQEVILLISMLEILNFFYFDVWITAVQLIQDEWIWFWIWFWSFMSLLSFSQEQQTIIWELMTSKLFLQSIYLIAKYSRKIYIKYMFFMVRNCGKILLRSLIQQVHFLPKFLL